MNSTGGKPHLSAASKSFQGARPRPAGSRSSAGSALTGSASPSRRGEYVSTQFSIARRMVCCP